MGIQILSGVYLEVPTPSAVQAVEEVFWLGKHGLAKQMDSRIEEGRLLPDYVYILLSVSPKQSVVEVVGYMKGNSAIHQARG